MADTRETAAKFNAAFNAHDEGALFELHAANIKFSAPGGVKLNSTAAATGYAMGFFKGFPNLKMTVRSEIVSGPWIVQEFTLDGVHSGPLEGPMGTIAATDKKVTMAGAHIFRIENSRIEEARVYFDQMELLGQLELLPVPAAV